MLFCGTLDFELYLPINNNPGIERNNIIVLEIGLRIGLGLVYNKV